MKKTKEYLHELFNTAYDFMMFSSVDGCSLIVSDDYKNIAELFEEWLNDNHPNHLQKEEDIPNISISFWNDQEGVVFKGSLTQNYHNMYEFIAILPSWYSELVANER